ncbi:MAG: hypothetical protein HRT98_03415 [Mycoplasmatales bacterium]|nr:hypothetical protein [Mycoplasmatales bacterium]
MSTFLRTQKKHGVIKFLKSHRYEINLKFTAKQLIEDFIRSNGIIMGVKNHDVLNKLYKEFQTTYSYKLFLVELDNWIKIKGFNCSKLSEEELEKLKKEREEKRLIEQKKKKEKIENQLTFW